MKIYYLFSFISMIEDNDGFRSGRILDSQKRDGGVHNPRKLDCGHKLLVATKRIQRDAESAQ